MILAELEVCHSRPIAPTRRIALGAHDLPVDPPPGFGGILLAGIVATFACALDEDLFGELGTLLRQVERGQRIRQPRLRHRFQQDRVGLMRVRHRLHGEGEVLRFDVDAGSASPAQHILAAVYASAQLRPVLRQPIIDGLRIGMQWKGPVGPALVARVSGRAGTASWSAAALSDPLGWARVTLGFALDDKITRSSIQRRFREQLRAVHPDHGAEAKGAAQRITDISEARRILLA
ncbi:MAG TPA: hypothetical protein VGQ20_05605 [Acidimicrobiales bacterium]|nr:hypothetical protein [Acidimicrobiales bacterium]